MLNWKNIKDLFPYTVEIPTIFTTVQLELEDNKSLLQKYPLLVDPYAFMLGIRKQEAGRKGREFGVMCPGALNTNLTTQATWAMATIIKDTRRWYLDVLICVGGRTKKDFKDFIEYFGTKYCPPIGAKNDPTGLNKSWLPNVKKNYKDFLI